MKKLIAMLLALAMVLSLAACGSSEPAATEAPKADAPVAEAPKADAPAAPAEEELEGDIVFWHSFTQGPRLETLQAAADSFMAANPKVTITIETFSWADFYTKWTTGLASGNVPDISTAQPGYVVEMIDADCILPLDNLIDEIGRDRFYQAPLTEMTADGQTWAVPIYSHAQVMWYRTDLLEKYGLEVPTTWDELYEAASIIQAGENGEVYGCSVPMGTNDMMATRYLNFYVRSAGETLITEDGKANLTSQAVIDGINYWIKMYKDNSPAESINFNVLDQATLYYLGKNAFDFNSGFQIGGVETNTPDLLDYIACAPMPGLTEDHGATAYETSNIPMVIWKNSKHPEICEAFIKYLYEPENYVPFLLSVPVGMLPALEEVSTDPAFLSDPMVQKYSDSMAVIAKGVGEGTAIGMEYGPKPEAGLITSQRVIENMFQDIIINGTPVEEAAAAAEEELNELFETVG